ncbi:hypothetical protein G8C92_23415 [Paenibacillus donghaensis]|uniref:hypothetical protein n=1 Tax=Paenibacillus donghaensis TaxID=414771 RepID=UPI0018843002|nr:hypothetical protein [Paenibacillus donghaensis]MBE9916972.1 hypothetical protein [Paenibacillus donghaensis]
MKHTAGFVPYGYEPPEQQNKGTLIYYDIFEEITDQELDKAEQMAAERHFSRFVLYPLHEETARRMVKQPVSAYHQRQRKLEEWIKERETFAEIERFEAKRKKYTPVDTALRHLTAKYPAPHFLYLTAEMANLLASYSSFPGWIVKLRLIVADKPEILHPLLEKYQSRWDAPEDPE